VVLDTLTPAERLAFVLHDMFGVPFEEIAPIVDRSPIARASRELRGAQAVARGALAFSRFARFARPALVNGAAGLVAAADGTFAVLGFTIVRGMVVEIDILTDPVRLAGLDLG
jgi:RNA polymerase sigma-70 factor, ECF subfamily